MTVLGRRASFAIQGAICLFALLRFAHVRIVWVEEAYGMAAAAEILRGKMLYRDIWFDKPPLYALFYTLCGAGGGIGLRLLGALLVLACAWTTYKFARSLWGEAEALTAAFLLAFFLTFGIPSAVIAAAPDLLMVVPHVLAVYFASRSKPFASGLAAGVALLTNVKAILVLAVCIVWLWRLSHRILAGFLIPQLALIAFLAFTGALGEYMLQVWQWSALYASDTFLPNPAAAALQRTINWAGFALTAVAGALYLFHRERSPKLLLWTAVSLAAVFAGWRFFPRYYFHLLPAVCLCGARGLQLMPRSWRMACFALLLIPFLRFGPRYATLATDLASGKPHEWSDLALQQDAAEAGAKLRSLAGEDASILVWGYRPEIFVYSKLPAGTRFLDSQPLTGVPADRHLTHSTPVAPGLAARLRQELMHGPPPQFIVDGLGPLNRELAIAAFLDLAPWLAQYEPAARTELSVIYRLSPNPSRDALLEKRSDSFLRVRRQ